MSIGISPIRLDGFLLASMIFLASAGSTQTGSPPARVSSRIAQIGVSRAGQQTIVRMEGDGRLSYEASRLSNPERLVLDFSGAHLAVSKSSIASDVKPVQRVRVSQFKPDMVRVVIDLERAVPYSVKAEGQSVTAAFAASAPSPLASKTPAAPPNETVMGIAQKLPVQPPATDLSATPPSQESTPPFAAVASAMPAAPEQTPAQNDAPSVSAPAQGAKYSGEPVLPKLNDAPVKTQYPAQGSKSELSASASTSPTEVRLPATVSEEYLINAEDVLEVYVFDVPELSRDYTVSAAGTVTVPLLPKPVQAAGLSSGEFARALEESFRQSGRLSRPQVTVAIKQSRRSVVTVEGAVKSPQALPVMARTKLVSILSQCGGLADDHGSTVTVSRGTLAMRSLALEGGPVTPTVTIELGKLMDGNDPMSQFAVWPGDRISVERAGIFYVLGQVGRPGGYNLKSAKEQVTVLEALAIAGDVTLVAKKSKAMIIRKDSTAPSGRNEVALNLAHILAGRSPDRVLQSNDILYIPASGGKRALQTLMGVPAAVVTSAGQAATYSRF